MKDPIILIFISLIILLNQDKFKLVSRRGIWLSGYLWKMFIKYINSPTSEEQRINNSNDYKSVKDDRDEF